jgi:hypothetical protein
MPNKFHLVLSCFILFILITEGSCRREMSVENALNNPLQDSSALEGNWTLVSVHAVSQATEQDTANGAIFTAVTTSAYTTTHNTGTVQFTADSMSGTGIGYSIADTSVEYDYINGGFLDSTVSPLSFTAPPANSSTFYQLIGTDSLSFPSGSSLITVPTIPGAPSGTLSGATFVINGNTMTMTSVTNQTIMVSILGVPEPLSVQATVSTVLQRQ